MRDAPIRRRLLEATHSMCKTNDAAQAMQEYAFVLDALGDLLSAWTGEAVRIQITAEGQSEAVDMTNRPGTH